jgi:hypothetical protein
MKRVIIESPYRANTWYLAPLQRWRNRRYARACLRHSLRLGEAPLASHLLYTQVLTDADAAERDWGIKAGLTWTEQADLCAVYTDRGISNGMQLGAEFARAHAIAVEYRSLKPKRVG